MRWPAVGTAVSMRRGVLDSDRAAFDDENIHDLYSTVAMVRDAEHVSRYVFRQGLEEGEEGAGASIQLRHDAPVPVGATVDVVATVTHAEGRRMETSVEFVHDGEVKATATFTQVVLGA